MLPLPQSPPLSLFISKRHLVMTFYLRKQVLILACSEFVVTSYTMKFQQLELAFFNKNSSTSSSSSSSSSSLTLGFKRLRPVIPSASTLKPVTSLELKSFSFSKSSSAPLQHQHVTLSGGGTRWNPTEEQIRKLESLYNGGMRTPNAQQIEKITAELIKHGRIEGKNVFYWFQNHKARERQKQKQKHNGLLSPSLPMDPNFCHTKGAEEKNESKDGRSKRRSRSWEVEELDQIIECSGDDRVTLELFPLHPEKINGNICF